MQLLALCLLCLLLGAAAPARAEPIELTTFEIVHNEDGVQLSFNARFDLPRGVEDALQKGVPLYFVVEANVFRERWYWLDRRIATASRAWRLAYQPLTRKYRVTFGGLNQSYDTLDEAMAVLRRVGAWRIAEAAQVEEGARHYLEFRYRLDTSQLPRPMQIGIGAQAEWELSVERLQRFN
jgi:hypothetical protein